MSKEKNRVLTIPQQLALGKVMERDAGRLSEVGHSHPELAAIYSKELGFPISKTTIPKIAKALGIVLKSKRVPGGNPRRGSSRLDSLSARAAELSETMEQVISRIEKLEDTLARVELFLGKAHGTNWTNFKGSI